ncbi:MAG: dihydrodipicolinate synthase family protein [Lapillicoccus sp.]
MTDPDPASDSRGRPDDSRSGPRPLHGVIPIPVTTFDEQGALDAAGLASQVDFSVAHGAHGILYPGVVSEFYTLTDEERHTAVETVVRAVGGRLPVVVGVTGASTAAAVAFTRHAVGLGVDGVMTMVPFVQHFFAPSTEYALRHVTAIAEAAGVPLILQNARVGFPLGLSALGDVVNAVPGVRYVKQESNPPTQDISGVVRVLGERIDGVFGGMGGVYMVNELDRGAAGTMPSPAFVDRIVEAYAAYRDVDAQAAQTVLDPMGSLFTRELLYNVVFHKEVLRRRGVIRSTSVRIASPVLDPADLVDLDRLMSAAEVR